MIRVILLLFALISPVRAANSVTFNLYDVTLADLVRVVIDDVSGASVVISPEVLEDQKRVSFLLKKSTPEQALQQLEAIAKQRGYDIERKAGVYHVRPAMQEQEMFVYVPRFRSVSYLTDLIGGIVSRTAVASQRQIQSGSTTMNTTGGQSMAQETGNNVTSMIDRGDKDILVIKAKPAEIQMVKKMLAEVDRPIPEMLVKAVIMEVQTGAVEGSAVNFVANLIAKGIGTADIKWNGAADSSNGVTIKAGGIEAIWSAISSDQRFKVVSAPQLRVRSGSSARFSVGADTPVLGSVSYANSGQAVQSVEYKSSGVILELRPEIRGSLAELKVFQQLSNFAKTETGVNNSPTLLKRELSTSVIVGQNDVVLLGGLDEEKTTTTDAGLFFFPRWLRSLSDSKSKTEIVLMLYVERIHTIN